MCSTLWEGITDSNRQPLRSHSPFSFNVSGASPSFTQRVFAVNASTNLPAFYNLALATGGFQPKTMVSLGRSDIMRVTVHITAHFTVTGL